jgi:hypothetical protein
MVASEPIAEFRGGDMQFPRDLGLGLPYRLDRDT